MSDSLNQMRNARVAVVGLGLTGLSVLRYLRGKGITPACFDSRESLNIKSQDEALFAGLNLKFGPFSDTEFNDFDFVIVSPGISLATPALANARALNDNVFCDVELFARVNSKPVLAVTGSNGKSTVVAWLEQFLTAAGKKAVACGNYGVPVLDVVDEDYDVFVVELSSFQLESTTSLVCEAATVLNVTEDHMDRYDTFDHYSLAKNKIYNQAKLCLYNHDDFATKPLISHPNVESFGGMSVCMERSCWHFDPESQGCYLNSNKLAEFSEFSVGGTHNALNALAVMAMARALGVNLEQNVQLLKTFNGLPHRCQKVARINGVDYINDSKATNIASTQAALKGLAKGQNVILLAGGDAKGGELSELADSIASSVKQVIAFGKDANQFASFLPEQKLALVEDLSSAVKLAAAKAQAGDLVLLSPACASIDMFANYQQRGDDFARYVLALEAEASA